MGKGNGMEAREAMGIERDGAGERAEERGEEIRIWSERVRNMGRTRGGDNRVRAIGWKCGLPPVHRWHA